MSRLAVYVDLDDVLSRTAEGLLGLADRMFGRRLGFDELHSFDLGQSFALSADQHRALMRAAHESEFVMALGVQPGALDCVGELHAAGCEIEVVTGRPPNTLDDASEWLFRQGFPELPVRSVDKYGRHPGAPGSLPLAWLRERAFDVAIEDSFETAQFLAEQTQARVLLLDRPWNADPLRGPSAKKITRVRDWTAISRQLS